MSKTVHCERGFLLGLVEVVNGACDQHVKPGRDNTIHCYHGNFPVALEDVAASRRCWYSHVYPDLKCGWSNAAWNGCGFLLVRLNLGQ